MPTPRRHRTSAPSDAERPSASWRARLAVWVVAMGVVLGGMSAMASVAREDQARWGAPGAQGPRSSTPVAEPVVVYGTQAQNLISQYGTGALCKIGTNGTKVCYTPATGDRAVLPPFRWHELGSISSKLGILSGNPISGVLNSVVSWMSDTLFIFANFVWTIMLAVVRLAATKDWMEDSAIAVNWVFVTMTPPMLVFLGAVWLIVLARSGRLALKGDVAGIGKALVSFLVPAAMLLVMFNGANASLSQGQAALPRYCKNEPLKCESKELRLASRASINPRNNVAVKSSPVYLASQGQRVFGYASDSVTGAVAGGLNGGNKDAFESSVVDAVGSDQDPDCGRYISALIKRYRASLAAPGAATGANGLPSGDRNAVFTHVSIAWVTGMYEPWSSAQFGDTQLKGVAACHFLEDQNGIAVGDRQITMGVAYPDLSVSDSRFKDKDGNIVKAAGHDSVYVLTVAKFKDQDALQKALGLAWTCIKITPAGCAIKGTVNVAKKGAGAVGNAAGDAVSNALLGDNTKFMEEDIPLDGVKAKEQMLRMANWGACRWTGKKWVLDPRWVAVGGDKSPGAQQGMSESQLKAYRADHKLSQVDKTAPTSEYCTFRWVHGHGAGTELTASPPGIAPTLGDITDTNIDKVTTAYDINSAAARDSYNGLMGKSVANRLVYGWMALIGSIAYFFMIGGPSIGLLASSMYLIFLLAFFPLVLAMAALGRPGGQKGVRMTIAMLGSKAVFSVLILLVVEMHFLMSLVTKSIDVDFSQVEGGGFVNTFLVVVSPLLVLMIMNKLAAAMGLGKLTSLAGAAGLVTGVAAKAANAGSMGGFLNGGSGNASRLFKAGKETGKMMLPDRVRNREEHRNLSKARGESELARQEVDELRARKAAKGDNWTDEEEEKLKAAESNAKAQEKRAQDRQRDLDRIATQDRKKRQAALGELGASVGAFTGINAVAGMGSAAGNAVGFTAGRWVPDQLEDARVRREAERREAEIDTGAMHAILGGDDFGVDALDPADTVDADAIRRRLLEEEATLSAWSDTGDTTIELDDLPAADRAKHMRAGTLNVLVNKTAHARGGRAAQLTKVEINHKRTAEAERLDVDPGHIVVSDLGIVMPDPTVPLDSLEPVLRSHPVVAAMEAGEIPPFDPATTTVEQWTEDAMLSMVEAGRVDISGERMTFTRDKRKNQNPYENPRNKRRRIKAENKEAERKERKDRKEVGDGSGSGKPRP